MLDKANFRDVAGERVFRDSPLNLFRISSSQTNSNEVIKYHKTLSGLLDVECQDQS